jgi:hypothetical protein
MGGGTAKVDDAVEAPTSALSTGVGRTSLLTYDDAPELNDDSGATMGLPLLAMAGRLAKYLSNMPIRGANTADRKVSLLGGTLVAANVVGRARCSATTLGVVAQMALSAMLEVRPDDDDDLTSLVVIGDDSISLRSSISSDTAVIAGVSEQTKRNSFL